MVFLIFSFPDVLWRWGFVTRVCRSIDLGLRQGSGGIKKGVMRVMATAVLHEEVGQCHHGISLSASSEMQVTKRQRRPSVRLGEIGDEPMPLVLEKPLKRKKLQDGPEVIAAAANDYICQGFGHETDPTFAGMTWSKSKCFRALKQGANPRADVDADNVSYENGEDALDVDEDHDTEDRLGLLHRVRVDFKKRTKRGKQFRTKCIIGNKLDVDRNSVNIASGLDENYGKILNSLGADAASDVIACTDGHKDIQTEQKVNRDFDYSLQKGNDHGDTLLEYETIEKLSSDGKDLTLKEVSEPKQEGVEEVCMNADPYLKEQVRDSEVNIYPHWSIVAAGINRSVPEVDEEMVALSVDAEGSFLCCEVSRWLEALSLGKYAYLFEVHEVDKDVLPLLTIEDLREMGIAAVGARRKLFTAIQVLSHKEV